MAPNTDIATRAFVVALKSPYFGKSNAEITEITQISKSQINCIYKHTIERGFNPELPYMILRDEWLRDASKSGRPTQGNDSIKDAILVKVQHDRYGREKSYTDLANEFSNEGIEISSMTIWRILRKAGLRKIKPTWKPGLTKKMWLDRLQFCLEHKN
ncbi:predicted protein [Histoplasma mississippiense (nom. inval.)]|uniref:predicted protein n=1 Tax=Ajellomyces capsulatus (strain NAm1 / WU24) TaxID=2059318 RepID=UPI000157CA24|nr:predicted protein [Histoplasma mississippiense (nom. inval.)]EDN09733.1 predicted protein [Histoplasma mississippiense (nom. inval.)]